MWRASLVRPLSLDFTSRITLSSSNPPPSPNSVNCFYRLNQEQPDPSSASDPERAKQEKEFKIGSIGLADSMGILVAALVAVPTEVELCRVQVGRGKELCRQL